MKFVGLQRGFDTIKQINEIQAPLVIRPVHERQQLLFRQELFVNHGRIAALCEKFVPLIV
ncbi:hypothetical protein DZD18_12025 [Rhodobacteraceae bacterium W635]|nr:hypothetical protein DZD18_12025 [Rhodobacteraceae bacterium W635]